MFQKSFLWGTSSSAFQIEGAWNEDGKGPSIWDIFNHTPGKIRDGNNADVTCDFYHHYKEDIKLMKNLGYKAFGLSLSWPRILPGGIGKINKDGVNFYKNVLKELEKNNISTMVTLYHWDLPQAIQEKGGWLVRKTAQAFADYADLCFKEFGDLVDLWVTLNEPQIVSIFGYYHGNFPPAIKKDIGKTLMVILNLLLAHGLAVEKYKKQNLPGQIRIKLYKSYYKPFNPDNKNDYYTIRHADEISFYTFSDAIMFGDYPASYYNMLRDNDVENFIVKGDLNIISQKIDFLGLDYYTCQYIEYDKKNPFSFSEHGSRELNKHPDESVFQWEDYPEGLYYILLDLGKRYKNFPIYIAENGKYIKDKEDKIDDYERIKYLQQHFESCAKAIKKGIKVKGYFVWCLLDSFEWEFGYVPKFGLIHVDLEGLNRTPKKSAIWYSKFIGENT